MAHSTRTACPAVLHIATTQHHCSGEAGHDEHTSASGYRWTSWGEILTRPIGYRSQQRARAARERDPEFVRAEIWAARLGAATESWPWFQDCYSSEVVDAWTAQWLERVGPDGPGRGEDGLRGWCSQKIRRQVERAEKAFDS